MLIDYCMCFRLGGGGFKKPKILPIQNLIVRVLKQYGQGEGGEGEDRKTDILGPYELSRKMPRTAW